MPRMEVPRKRLVRESQRTAFTPEEELMSTRRARLIENESNQIAEDLKNFCVQIYKGEISREEAEAKINDKISVLLNTIENSRQKEQ